MVRLAYLSGRARAELSRNERVYDSEVTVHVLAIAEAGKLIPMCAWCKRVEINGEWLPTPHRALAMIDERNTVSHSICPACVAQPTG